MKSNKTSIAIVRSALYLSINHHGRVLYGCEDKDKASERLYSEYPHLVQQRVDLGIILTYPRCDK